ncbi:Skp1 family, dimerization domain-containing protein [Obelidium mucronatum]|nr:Skp1 family, dimerization domain-containing protein [Obelidium mucronatum]
MVKVTSSDGKEFTIEKEIANQSVLIKGMLEDVGELEDQAIPLPNVTGKTLERVIAYCQAHKDDPPADPEAKPKPSEDIDEADKVFMAAMDRSEKFEIILAANYLDIKSLLDLGCKTIANMIKGKSTEEVMEALGIEDSGFTPEEIEQIKRDNDWNPPEEKKEDEEEKKEDKPAEESKSD